MIRLDVAARFVIDAASADRIEVCGAKEPLNQAGAQVIGAPGNHFDPKPVASLPCPIMAIAGTPENEF